MVDGSFFQRWIILPGMIFFFEVWDNEFFRSQFVKFINIRSHCSTDWFSLSGENWQCWKLTATSCSKFWILFELVVSQRDLYVYLITFQYFYSFMLAYIYDDFEIFEKSMGSIRQSLIRSYPVNKLCTYD